MNKEVIQVRKFISKHLVRDINWDYGATKKVLIRERKKCIDYFTKQYLKGLLKDTALYSCNNYGYFEYYNPNLNRP